MKIVTFSDTHNCHDQVVLPDCDNCIFGGDLSGRGNRIETSFFFRWYNAQTQCKHKIMIVGNHDICFQEKFNEETQANRWLETLIAQYPDIIVLDNRYPDGVRIEGINIYGSPATPWYHGERWAFNYHRQDIAEIWSKIPTNTDILITHGPAYGILDKTLTEKNAGCPELLQRIKEIKPKYHICGHIHESYGAHYEDETMHINCSIIDKDYYPTNKPIDFIY